VGAGPVARSRIGAAGTIKRSHPAREAADTWIAQMQNASRTGIDSTQTLTEYVIFIGDRWTRGIDPTSTSDLVGGGLCQARQRACLVRPWSAGRLDLLSLT
jgi:hypothetical protein